MIENIINPIDQSIQVLHKSLDSKNLFPEAIVFYGDGENNTISRVVKGDFEFFVLWERHSSALKFEVLYIPETKVFYFGCGSISGGVSEISKSIVFQNEVTLFWGFSIEKGYVLETGELECFLYNFEGRQISKIQVDPPYEYIVYDNGIKFYFMTMGSTWLSFNERSSDH